VSEPLKPGQKGRGMLAEVFGAMPLPAAPMHFDPCYDDYWEERIGGKMTNEPTLRRTRGVLPYIAAGDSVLDVGCGTGETLRLLVEARGIVGTGLDVSAHALDQVAAMGFDALRMDLADPHAELPGEFDHILVFEVIEHVVDAETFLLKLKGRFRKGLYVTTPNLGYLSHRLRMLFGRFPITYLMDPREHVRYWTTADFCHWLRWLGFPQPEVIGLCGRFWLFGLYRWWPSLWAFETLYRITP